MTAEIICVGTELLLGDIVNTNAQFLSRELDAATLNRLIKEIRELRQEIVQLGGVYRGNSKTHRK